MRIVNPDSDHHMHTLNFSDGLSTVEELVRHAGSLGLKRIAITDHSDDNRRAWSRTGVSGRPVVKRWRNVHNDVDVVFGVEADVLNRKGDICDTIEGVRGGFLVLSAHRESYQDGHETITEAYLNALERFHDRIDVLGHLDAVYFKDHVDVRKVVEAANEYGIPLELNGSGLLKGSSVPEHTRMILKRADRVMVNSDAHCLSDLYDARRKAFDFIRDNGFLDRVENRHEIEILK